MPRDGSGGYLPPQNSWNPAINNNAALPNDWMAVLNDIAATLQASLAADGQTPITGIMNFGLNRASNLGAPIGAGDALRFEQLSRGPDIASAATIAVPIEGQFFSVTGSAAITAIAPMTAGRLVYFKLDAGIVLTHSAGLLLPDAKNITSQADDVAVFLSVSPGIWRCVSYPNRLYSRDNILGTVSQLGGTPTGAIIQAGSNSNGRYVRFADGTQWCFHTKPGNFQLTQASGNIFVSSGNEPWTFPIAFITPPEFDAFVMASVPYAWAVLGDTQATTQTAATFRVATGYSTSLVPDFNLMAAGRWYL